MSSNSTKIVSCLCGGVKFKVKDKLRHVLNCHCSQCMKTHGNFAAYTSALEKNLKFISKKNIKQINKDIRETVIEDIKGFDAICKGEYDHLPESAFYMVGTIEEAVQKAEKMAKEAAA